MKVVASNRVLCNNGTYDITNGAVAPCDSAGGVKVQAPTKSMTTMHIGLFVGGVAVGYLLCKLMKN